MRLRLSTSCRLTCASPRKLFSPLRSHTSMLTVCSSAPLICSASVASNPLFWLLNEIAGTPSCVLKG